MRIERTKIGARVRLFLNRREVTRAAKTFLPEGADPRRAALQSRKLEHACRILVADSPEARVQGDTGESPFVVPLTAKFTVGVDDNGALTGATFEWNEAED